MAGEITVELSIVKVYNMYIVEDFTKNHSDISTYIMDVT